MSFDSSVVYREGNKRGMIRRSKYCALAVFTHLIYLSPSKYKFSVISVSSKRITRMPLEVMESHMIATVSAS